MIGAATGAIPVYVGLLGLVMPEQYRFTGWEQVFVTTPVVLLLFAAILFVVGYFPGKGSGSLDNLGDINNLRNESINHRHCFALFGFAIFVLGVLGASLVTLFLRPS